MYTSDISKERKEYLRKANIEKRAVMLLRIAAIVLFISIWEASAYFGLIDDFIVSSPSRILTTIINLVNGGELFYHLGVSCLETVIGFVCGTLFGSFIAAILWWSKPVYRVVEPFLVVLNSLPKTALGPIFIVWAGAGPSSIVLVTISVSIVVTILEVLNGFMQTDPDSILLLRSFGANKLQIFLKVVLPANFETIMNSLKVNVGLSWVGVIVGEFLVSKAGIGYLIVYGSAVFKMDLVMASILLLAAAATIMYRIVVVIGSFVMKKRT